MRGKVLAALGSTHGRGITPACAGKRSQGVAALQLGWDHPRVCGEKHLPAAAMQGCPGITPACAGKRDIPPQGSTAPGDHPRVCGEKPELPPAVQRHVGSPPRMRGKGSRMTRATSMVGITPACAGKSARRQAGPPGPAPPPQMRLGWSPPPCTGRQCRTRKSTHARRARIPVPAHTPAPQ